MNKFIFISLISLVIFSIGIIFAENLYIIELEQGKNNITFNSEPVYAKTLIEKNPEIISISYIDEFYNNSVGYVNVFGGIGTNFILIENQTYEIISKQKTTIYLTN